MRQSLLQWYRLVSYVFFLGRDHCLHSTHADMPPASLWPCQWSHHQPLLQVGLCTPHPLVCQRFFTRADGNHWSILLPPENGAGLEGGASPSSRHTALGTMEISRFCWMLGSTFALTSNFGGHMAMIPSSPPQHIILLGFQKLSQDCFPTAPFSWQHRGKPGCLLLSRSLAGKRDARPCFS